MTESTLLLEKIRVLVEAQRGEGVSVSVWASRELADAVHELDQLLSNHAPLPEQWETVIPMQPSAGLHAFLGGMAGSFLGSLAREEQPKPAKQAKPAKRKRLKP